MAVLAMKLCSKLLLLYSVTMCIATEADDSFLLTVSDTAEAVTDKTSSSGSCDTLYSLAQSLYDNKGNVLNLTRVFYPPRQPGVNFLQVKYYFENATGDINDCFVTYIWAKGGFMLIQPPSILQYTSLFFSHNVNTNYHLTLRLPNACRHLVDKGMENETNCTCDQEEDDLLDMLTHQVSL